MLNNLSIKSKLLLSMILPIIGMIYFASININERYQNAQESAQIYNTVTLNIKISDLVHELQKERGKSSGFISSKGSKFDTELSEQKELTNQSIDLLKKYLNNLAIKEEDNKFIEFKKTIYKNINNLDTIRIQVNSLQLDTNTAISKYSTINKFLLKFIYSTSKNTHNAEMSSAILSYSNFLLLKEKTGIERAIVTKMLINNDNDQKNRLMLSNLIILQKNFISQFLKLTTPDNIEKFHKLVYSNKLDKEIKRIENIVLLSNKQTNIKPSYWFDLITRKIDKQNILAYEFSKELILLSEKQKNNASNDMIFYNTIAFSILLIAIVLFIMIMKNISISVDGILNGILNISKVKITDFKDIKIKTEDEFGTIADTLNKMTKELIKKEEQKKEADMALEKQYNYLQSIVDSIDDSIMVIRDDYSVELMNDTIKKKLNPKDIADINNPKCYEISHHRSSPCDGQDHHCPLIEVLETKKGVTVMHNHSTTDEKEYIELAATPFFDENENCVGIIELGRDMTSHIELKCKLDEQKNTFYHQAHHDTLTGLANRALFDDRLDQGIKKVKRNAKKLALFFIDLDKFKYINDTFGHKAGDLVLSTTALRIKQNIREEDTVSRIGGDEFTIIMENIDKSEYSLILAKKIMKAITEPIKFENHILNISGSIGISIYPDDDLDAHILIKYADEAMYKAKENGRNNVKFYNGDLNE